MKKVLLGIGVVVAIFAMTSCSKTRTCVCEVTTSVAGVGTGTITIPATDYDDIKSCNDLDSENTILGVTTVQDCYAD